MASVIRWSILESFLNRQTLSTTLQFSFEFLKTVRFNEKICRRRSQKKKKKNAINRVVILTGVKMKSVFP